MISYKCACQNEKLLQDLYYCTQCEVVKCKECVVEETATHYCPFCMFEVPSASIKTERATCGRNCFKCPVCVCPLLVSSDTKGNVLHCVQCGWDSLDIGLTFERPTGLSAQLSKNNLNRFDLEYFKELQGYYDKMVKYYKEPVGGFTFSKSLSAYGMLANTPKAPLEPFKSSLVIPLETRENVNVSNMVTLKQSHQQVGYGCVIRTQQQLKPLGVQLRRKTIKKCKACELVLVKPDNKAVSTQFVTKSMAWNSIPRLVLKPFAFEIGKEYEIVVEVTNPTLNSISLEFQVLSEDGCQLQLETKTMELGPYKDLWTSREPLAHQSILKCRIIPTELQVKIPMSMQIKNTESQDPLKSPVLIHFNINISQATN